MDQNRETKRSKGRLWAREKRIEQEGSKSEWTASTSRNKVNPGFGKDCQKSWEWGEGLARPERNLGHVSNTGTAAGKISS